MIERMETKQNGDVDTCCLGATILGWCAYVLLPCPAWTNFSWLDLVGKCWTAGYADDYYGD